MSLPQDIVVTGIGVVSPLGDTPYVRLDGPLPDLKESWFDPRTRLGRRGYKYLPRSCQYLLAAVRAAVADGGDLGGVPAERRGAAIATNSGLAVVLDDMDRTVADGHANDLSPAGAPFFAINVLGSRLSGEHGLKGFQLTMTSPRVAGLEAVESGLRALAAGRCSTLLVAAMEDGLREWEPEQGAVALVFERRAAAVARGARVYGTCRARTFFAPPRMMRTAQARRRLADTLDSVLSDLDVGEKSPIHPILDGSPVAVAVGAALAEGGRDRRVRAPLRAGPGCLTPMLRLAGLVATAGERAAGEEGDGALMVVATGEGNIAVARTCAVGDARSRERLTHTWRGDERC